MSSASKPLSKRAAGTPSKKNVETHQASKELKDLEVKLVETDGWLTRNEACDVLRCSPQTLKNYEDRKKLHPQHAIRKDRRDGERVMLVYNPKELAALPLRNGGGQPSIQVREPGEQAARAFELLRQGMALDEIVIELRETPDRIHYLNERWLEQTQARCVITPEAKVAFEQLLGAFNDVTDLLDLVRKRLSKS
jgi:hypothetical protein